MPEWLGEAKKFGGIPPQAVSANPGGNRTAPYLAAAAVAFVFSS